MNYGITRGVIGCKQFIEIRKEEFERTAKARDLFFKSLGIEEKFDLVAENYAEWEQELLRLTIRDACFFEQNWSSFRQDIGLINRRCANLLSACRLYVDQVQADISSMYGKDSKHLKSLKAARSHEFDTRIGYAILESIRNFMQHRGLPLFKLSYQRSMVEPLLPGGVFRCVCIPQISIARLTGLGVFKRVVQERLTNEVDFLDLRCLIREYVAGLGCVHKKVREWTMTDVAKWRRQILKMRNRFRRKYGKKHLGLGIVERDENNRRTRWVEIFDAFIDEHARLVQKNAHPAMYDRQFVSGEESKEKKRNSRTVRVGG